MSRPNPSFTESLWDIPANIYFLPKTDTMRPRSLLTFWCLFCAITIGSASDLAHENAPYTNGATLFLLPAKQAISSVDLTPYPRPIFRVKTDTFRVPRSDIFYPLSGGSFSLLDRSLVLLQKQAWHFTPLSNGIPLRVIHTDLLSDGVNIPAAVIGEYPGSVFGYGYLTVDQPTDDLSANIARFRDDGSTQVQINRGSANYQLQVFGDASASGMWTGSDRSLKTDIQPLRNTLNAIRQLNPSAYYFKQSGEGLDYLPTERQFGLMAQELASIFPNLVREARRLSETGRSDSMVLHVNYTGLVPVLIAAVQELDSQLVAKDQVLANLRQHLHDQRLQIQELQKQVEQLYTLHWETQKNNNQTVYLSQNVPNPMRETSEISFTIPVTVTKAHLRISAVDGRVIQSHTIEERGRGSISISRGSLSTGTYFYSLVLDQKVVKTRSLLVTQ
jgi:hypothetical protein